MPLRTLLLIDGNSLDLPRLLRPADRPGHRLRAGHQRGVRVHVDAHQPAARPPPRRAGGRLRPARADVPPRAGRDLQGQPQRGARHPAPADGPGPPGRRDASASRSSSWPGFEADDIIATLATQARDDGRRRHRRHRRPRQLPAGRGPAHQGPLQQAGRVRLRALRRGRHRGAHRRPPRPVLAVRRAAGRPVRQPARRARGGGEDGGQADQHLRRPRRHLRQPRRADAQAARRTWREHEAQVRAERRGDGAASATSPLDVEHRRPRRWAPIDVDEVRELFDFLEFRTLLRPAGRGARRPTSGPSRPARPRCSRPRSPRSTEPAEAVAAARAAGRRGDGPLARGRRRGRATTGAPPLDGPGPRHRRRRPAEVAWLPGDAARRRRGARRAGRAARRRAAARSPPTRPSRCVRALARPRHRRARARPRHRLAAYLLDPAEPATCSRSCSLRYAGARAAADGDAAADGPARPRRRRPGRPRPRRRPPGRWPSTGWSPRCSTRSTPRACARSTTRSRCRWSRVLARMEDVGVGVDVEPSCSALRDRLGGRGATRLQPADLGRRRATSSTSTPPRSCARSCSTSSASRPQKKTKTGFSTDAASAREAARPAPDHRAPARATARSRSCARPTATACWPRSRADGRIHATFNQTVARTGRLSSDAAQPAQHPGALRAGPRVPQGVRARRAAASCWSPTTTRSSCAASPTWPRTRA